MPARSPRLIPLLGCLLVAALAGAPGASATTTFPTISSVSPKNLGIGDTMTIKGKGFRSGKNRNTVVFKRDGGRAIFVKAPSATATKITVVLPPKLLPFLKVKDGKPVITRFRVRILARRFGKSFTSRSASPLIGPNATTPGGGAAADPDTDHDGILNVDDLDDDNDLLPDTREATLGTDPEKADSDGDGVSDGFEYYSALDLNSAAIPYPGKRPFPNALDARDAGSDFDGDSLTLAEEYRAWIMTGAPFPLTYSDGTQYTGGKNAATPSQDLDGNGWLSDDEKDVDNDGLANFDEAHGPLSSEKWWVDTYGGSTPPESEYPGPAYDGTSFTDADSDGDGVPDGADDQDHDGYSNAFEAHRPTDWLTTYVSITHAGTDPLARVQPFNPCKPIYSDACHTHAPIGYYDAAEDWESPIHAPYP